MGYNDGVIVEILKEVERSRMHGEKFASAHEAHSVILEEVEEFWEIVKMKKCVRDPEKMRKELVQVTAMAVKAIGSMENFVGGEV